MAIEKQLWSKKANAGGDSLIRVVEIVLLTQIACTMTNDGGKQIMETLGETNAAMPLDVSSIYEGPLTRRKNRKAFPRPFYF